MKKYDVLLFDADDTLLDFTQSEKIAVQEVMKHYGINPTLENCQLYHEININYWKMFENNLIDKPSLLVKRFAEFFDKLGKKENPEEINKLYFSILREQSILLPNALELVKRISKQYPLYIVTNGTAIVQERRMELSPIKQYITKIYISEKIGYQKPKKEFFDYVFNDLKITNPQRVILLGDSLTSDIQGGVNAGIDTCWFNPRHKVATINSTYEIDNLLDFINIIK